MSSDIEEKIFYENKRRVNVNTEYSKSHLGHEIDKKSYQTFHIHISDKKDARSLDDICNTISKLDLSKTLSIDIGGSFEKYSYFQIYGLLTKLRNIVPINIKLYFEPGELWFKNSGYLISKIIKINTLRNTDYVFVNSSREAHAKWSNPYIKMICKGNNSYVICGRSCFEKDIFCTLRQSKKLKVNQIIVFENISPYSYSWNASFNGIEKAKVIVDEK